MKTYLPGVLGKLRSSREISGVQRETLECKGKLWSSKGSSGAQGEAPEFKENLNKYNYILARNNYRNHGRMPVGFSLTTDT
jgi:hypothetical protein